MFSQIHKMPLLRKYIICALIIIWLMRKCCSLIVYASTQVLEHVVAFVYMPLSVALFMHVCACLLLFGFRNMAQSAVYNTLVFPVALRQLGAHIHNEWTCRWYPWSEIRVLGIIVRICNRVRMRIYMFKCCGSKPQRRLLVPAGDA